MSFQPLCDCGKPATRYTQSRYRTELISGHVGYLKGLKLGFCEEHMPPGAKLIVAELKGEEALARCLSAITPEMEADIVLRGNSYAAISVAGEMEPIPTLSVSDVAQLYRVPEHLLHGEPVPDVIVENKEQRGS